VIAGKIMIFIISMPIITNLFNLILDLLWLKLKDIKNLIGINLFWLF
jgi:hypothetical protein